MRFGIALLMIACEPTTSVVVLNRADLVPLPGIQVVFHRGRDIVADVRTDALGAVAFEAGEDVEVSVRAPEYAETLTAVPAGARVEVLIDLPAELRMIEIVPPPLMPAQVDYRWSSACGPSGTRASSAPFMVETRCSREAIAMIARDASGETMGWSALGSEGTRIELPPWSREWSTLEVRVENAPDGATIELQVVPEIEGRRAYVLGTKATSSAELQVAPIGAWVLSARVWWGNELTTRLWTTPAPVSPLTVDLSSLLPRVGTATIAGTAVEWSIDSARIDGGVITAVYPDERLLFWNVVVPPETTRVEFPPLAWTASTAFEIDVEMLDADFVADYDQRVRELGPGFFPRDDRETWSLDITTARLFP